MHQLPIPQNATRVHDDRNTVTSLMDVRPAPAKVEPASMGGIDLPAALRKRPLLALSILILTLLAAAPYLLRKVPRTYHAEAAIYVSPTYFKNLQQDREQLQISYTTLVNQQILTLRRYDILHEALMRLESQGIKYREPGESEEAAVARLTKDLDVQHIADSYEVLVGLDSPAHDWVAPIVNTVANTYLEKGKADDLADRSNRMSALTTEQNNLRAELQKKLDQQSQLSQDLLTVSLDRATPVDDTLLAGARQAQEDAHRRRMEAEAQLSIMETSKSGTGKNPLAVLTEEAVANDTNLHTTMNNLVQRRSELQARILGLTPQHPFRQSAEKDIAAIDDQLIRLPQGAIDETSARLLAKLRAEVDRSRMVESELNADAQTYASRVQSRTKQVQEAQGLGADIDRLRRDMTAVTSRISEMNLGDTDPSSYLRMFSAAQTPIEPKKANTKKTLAVLFGLAFFLAIAVPVAMDLIDQRILSPAEVKRAIGFPPVGLVLESSPGTRAFADEHFRRLVNGIQRGMAAQEAKTVVLTPLNRAGNAGSFVTDLAAALRVRGLKTIIVDANPEYEWKTALENREDGSPAAEPSSAITENKGSLVPPMERTRIPAAASLGSFVEEARQEYDVVLIDTPPLRLSADAEFLASVSDITLMVVETGKATRRELSDEAALLGRIGAPSIGVIMSQVRLGSAGPALQRDFKKFCSLSSVKRSSASDPGRSKTRVRLRLRFGRSKL